MEDVLSEGVEKGRGAESGGPKALDPGIRVNLWRRALNRRL